MKRFISILTVILFFTVPNVVYADAVDVYCSFDSDSDFKLNRGFNIYLNLKGSNNNIRLSAFRIDIGFDSTKLKFLSAEAADKDSASIRTSLINDDTVRLLYINTAGQKITNQLSQICSIRFKPTVAPDNLEYSFSSKILEAGTSNAEYLSIMNNPSFTISSDGTLNIDSDGFNNPSENKSSGSSSGSGRHKNESSAASSDKNSSTDSDDRSPGDSDNNIDNDISVGRRKQLNSESGFGYFLSGALAVLILAGIAFGAYRLGKKSKNKNG